ncbi:N-acetylmuramoyl-L-alanine amidase [Nonomuraea sp. KC401]|uniref:N-acetylmuramoyl-L-alanine amidase n=1 Tax=unclassified Nonomuraea TaxID=2593643 RepID=UPI0010FEBCC9|nr:MULTISPECIES: N-acetylmuramoyl-L-alanine amidase [unclassified Nonomuraea]NBE94327.1 N-acetylmuramoyl-L-alanine amidase [Nonomuraea sp. K271]TLF73138.1 N-acetylmuramoyl-L-alanine amidase [Nonomuraea sp. KC401]
MAAFRTVSAALVTLAALSAACAGAVPAVRQAKAPAAPSAASSPTGRGGPLAGKIVVIDPGHNGGNAAHREEIDRLVDVITGRKPCNTTGTRTGSGYPEHAFTWDVANRLKPLLEEMGAKVVLTRPDDKGVGPCVTERAAIGNEARADAVVSIHGDGAAESGHGFHVIMPGLIAGHNDAIIKPSRRLGLAIRKAYRVGTRMPYATYVGRDGLQTRTDLGGLNLSKRPAVFIECGNMRNSRDAARMTRPAFRERIATSLAAGLRQYLR